MVTILATILLIIALLLLPGLALLRLSGAWADWRRLQQIALAFGIGLSLYPALFYFLRLLAPDFHVQAWMGWGLLALSSAVALSDLRHWRCSLRRPDLWLVAIIVLLTIFSRIWIVWDQPYPAWTDSLHHTLLTKLTAEQGQLPISLQPYFDIPLAMYHLGLYTLTGLVAQMLALPAHTALLWTAQTLNALSVVGVFLVLDRYAGRTGAIIGMLVVGLLSHQPAFYVNWGRFTQLSSQTLMLIAWVMTIDTIQSWQTLYPHQKRRIGAQIVIAGVASAAVFLYHFRVSIFYIALLAPSIAYIWLRAARPRRFTGALISTILIGAVALITIMPVVWPAIHTWLQLNQAAAEMPVASPEQLQQNEAGFFAFDVTHFPLLAARTWLLALAGICALYGAWRRNRIVWLSVLWFTLLMLVGNLYLLGVAELNLTNLGAILIMLYMLIALVIGAACQDLVDSLPAQWAHTIRRYGAIAALLVALPFVWIRSHDFEAFRYFVTPADVAGMEWLTANIDSTADPDAKVAINTTFWLPTSPHGVDAGYWIPYFTNRVTNTGVMISSLGGVELVKQIIADSTLVKQAESDPSALAALYARGYRYLYIGALGNYDGGGFNPEIIAQSDLATKIYDQDGVTIFALVKK
ncbi:MAG TPA: hypothetical protein PL187_20655 [Caldilinea sp.]|nr:hypothetical protein [Anaerolineales bacterium]HRA68448.1 hypothetical protein [Caldilinea sp.]